MNPALPRPEGRQVEARTAYEKAAIGVASPAWQADTAPLLPPNVSRTRDGQRTHCVASTAPRQPCRGAAAAGSERLCRSGFQARSRRRIRRPAEFHRHRGTCNLARGQPRSRRRISASADQVEQGARLGVRSLSRHPRGGVTRAARRSRQAPSRHNRPSPHSWQYWAVIPAFADQSDHKPPQPATIPQL